MYTYTYMYIYAYVYIHMYIYINPSLNDAVLQAHQRLIQAHLLQIVDDICHCKPRTRILPQTITDDIPRDRVFNPPKTHGNFALLSL